MLDHPEESDSPPLTAMVLIIDGSAMMASEIVAGSQQEASVTKEEVPTTPKAPASPPLLVLSRQMSLLCSLLARMSDEGRCWPSAECQSCDSRARPPTHNPSSFIHHHLHR